MGVEIKVVVLPRSTAHLDAISHKAPHLPYLQRITLAHPIGSDDVFHISKLIEADYYRGVVQNHVIRRRESKLAI